MELGIAGKVALVTGASAGIGRAIAAELVREGVRLALIGRDAQRLDTAASALSDEGPGRALAVTCDCTVPQDIERAVARTQEVFGSIDILVNNAGATPMGRLDTLDDAEWERSWSLKVMGYVRFARAVIPGMRARRWGRIVNVIGRSGYQPLPDYIAGSTINAALLAFTKALSKQLAPDNVLVNGINPGPIDTERWELVTRQRAALEVVDPAAIHARAVASVPQGRLGRAEEVAAMAAILCSERASFVSGALLNVDGGSLACI
ncbi:MAG TPA: SDR family oxidoreductase [Azospirillum sp.]|nr:SDR family oxidoreductase [Azospirillum sp.]